MTKEEEAAAAQEEEDRRPIWFDEDAPGANCERRHIVVSAADVTSAAQAEVRAGAVFSSQPLWSRGGAPRAYPQGMPRGR